jgi:hypothetical protein
MNKDAAQRFQLECERAFGFLVTSYGFAPATIEIDAQIHFVTVTFNGKNLALECIYDERESGIEVKVARVVNGVVATEYAVNAQGERVRERLFILLLERGVRSVGLKDARLETRPLDEMFRIKLSAYADLLRAHAKDILDDSAAALTRRAKSFSGGS